MRPQRWIYTIPLRVRSLFKRRVADRELDEELEYHLEQKILNFVAKGLSEKEARYAALREFRGVQQAKENCRDARKVNLIQDFTQDLRFGARMLRKNPGFTAVAILTLALGIGANATIFSLVNAVLYKNLPFADSDRILYVSGVDRTGKEDNLGVSLPDYRDFSSQAKCFQSLAAAMLDSALLVDGIGFPSRYVDTRMTVNGFTVIGQKPTLGRDFLPEDGRVGAAPVAILSYGLWETRYGKDSAIVGKIVHINDTPIVVIGIMPPGLRFPGQTDLWLPLIPTPELEKREARNLWMFGHLARTASLSIAAAEMNSIAHRLEIAYPVSNKNVGVVVQTFIYFSISSKVRNVLLALLGAVGFVLLIACSNVANLLLSRAAVRSREISIRVALGATRWRVARQLLVESVLLSIAGGFFGCILALWSVRIFDKAITPNGKPAFVNFSMDYRVLFYFAAITVSTGVLFGLAPAFRLSKLDVNSALKDGASGSGTGLRSRYLSSVFVVTEVALAVVLLSGAGLMIRTFLSSYDGSLGVNSNNVLVSQIMLSRTKYKTVESQTAFYQQLQTRLKSLPGVESSAFTSNLPGMGSLRFPYELEGISANEACARAQIGAVVISPEYFSAMSLRPIQGRAFTPQDGATGVPVVLVNESFAVGHWSNQSPLGKRLRLATLLSGSSGSGSETLQPWLTVVGVVPDIVQDSSRSITDQLIYLPLQQNPQSAIWVALRTNVPPSSLATPLRHETQMVDENLAVSGVDTLESLLALRTWPWRIFGSMFTIFSFIALVLATVGLYGLIAHSVSQRTKEFGVRVALGASPRAILRLVFVQGMRQLAIGMTIGLVAALAVTRAAKGVLIGVSTTDPITFGTVTLVLVAVGAVACMIPGRRATRVDPVVSLRNE